MTRHWMSSTRTKLHSHPLLQTESWGSGHMWEMVRNTKKSHCPLSRMPLRNGAARGISIDASRTSAPQRAFYGTAATLSRTAEVASWCIRSKPNRSTPGSPRSIGITGGGSRQRRALGGSTSNDSVRRALDLNTRLKHMDHSHGSDKCARACGQHPWPSCLIRPSRKPACPERSGWDERSLKGRNFHSYLHSFTSFKIQTLTLSIRYEHTEGT